ncbi:MAG: hypothetical protein LBC71_07530 [Oscillospiraceae bacterium]|jgi:hypothetical protein|nr:hypothetical protein [Oscillospiraceae bacterium]
MIQQIDNQEVLTARQAMQKYDKKYIGFFVVKQNMRNPDFEEGHVIFLADSYIEGLDESMDSDDNIGVLRGYDVNEPAEVGGLEVVWR